MNRSPRDRFTTAETKPPNPIWKLLGAGYLLAFAAALFHSLWGDTLGFDIWFHLKNGWRIVTTGSIPHDDPSLPATAILGGWYFPNYEWLFGVLSYGVFSLGGTGGLDTLRLLLVSATFGLCLLTAVREIRRTSDPEGSWAILPAAAAVLLLAAAASTKRFEPRPHLISAFGLAWLSFVFSARPSLPGLLLTGVIMAVWANSHIEFMFGLGLIVLFAFRELLELWIDPPDADRIGNHQDPATEVPPWKSRLRPLAALFGLGILLFLLTPASWRVIPLAAEYYARQAATLQQFGFGVNEMLPLSEWRGGPWGTLLALTVAGLLMAPNRGRLLLRALPALPFCVLPLTSARHLLPAVILLCPHLISILHAALERVAATGSEARKAAGLASLAFLPMFFLLFGQAFTNPRLPHPVLDGGATGYLPYRQPNFYPEQALRFLRNERVKGTVFTLDRWGNFLLAFDGLQASTPERRPFIHNMGQTFPFQLLEDYLTIITKSDDRAPLLEKYKIDIVLLPLRQAEYFQDLANWLQASSNWRLVSFDDTAVVFLRHSANIDLRPDLPGLQAIRPSTFTTDENALRNSSDFDLAVVELERHLATPHGAVAWNAHVWLGTILEWQEEEAQAIEVLRRARSLNPTGFAALFRLGGLLGKTGKTDEAREVLAQARAICPADAANRFNLAIAFKKNRQYDECRQFLKEALQADPGFTPARKQLEALSQL